MFYTACRRPQGDGALGACLQGDLFSNSPPISILPFPVSIPHSLKDTSWDRPKKEVTCTQILISRSASEGTQLKSERIIKNFINY